MESINILLTIRSLSEICADVLRGTGSSCGRASIRRFILNPIPSFFGSRARVFEEKEILLILVFLSISFRVHHGGLKALLHLEALETLLRHLLLSLLVT